MLYDDWRDDKDDEEQFDSVCQAHSTLDEYCRNIQYGEFDHPAISINEVVCGWSQPVSEEEVAS